MVENEGKYRRWAWGAVIGLAVVIIIAGIVMAASLSSPKPTTDTQVAKAETTKQGTKTETTTEQKETKVETKVENTVTNKDDQNTIIEKHINPDVNKQSTETKTTTTTTTTNNASSSSNMPKTGPEDSIMPIIALAISGALIGYNVVLKKKVA